MPIAVGDHERAVEIGSNGGRPPGSKDRKWAQAEHWYNLLMENWDELTASERASIAIKGFGIVVAKKAAHETPDESVENADAAFKMLKLLQEVSKSGTHAGVSQAGDKVGLVDGGLAPQAPEAPARPV